MQTVELLDKYFETAFAAPDGIKRLRELILTLAMQGKLVSQNSQDRPASELLKEIEAEKKRLIKEKKIKKSKPLPEITPDEIPYDLPDSWKWVRLGNLVQLLNGRAYKRSELLDSGTPVLRVGNLFTSNKWYYSNLSLDENKYIDKGDLIYAWSASFNPFIWNGDKVIYHYHIWKIKFYIEIFLYKEYFYNYLLGATEKIKSSGNGIAMIHITKERMEKFLVPLPPLEEQHRIVEKIDRLMEKVDRLEKLQVKRDRQQLNIHAAASDRLLNAPDKNSFNDAWNFIQNNFNQLYSVTENISELRKTILQLAVMGKLVPQDLNDPPASKLLTKIEAEKKRLIKEGKIKKQKPLQEIKPEEVPYDLPKSWEWSRLGNLILQMDAGWSPKCEIFPALDDEWGVLKTTSVQPLLFQPYENKSLPKTLKPKPESEVKEGDILITRAGPKNRVGICCVVKEVRPYLMLSDKIIRFKIFGNLIDSYYCALCLNIGFGAYQIDKMKSGMAESQMNISQAKIKKIFIPLPPLPEQHRIVAKVDRLMALCDELEAQLTNRTEKQTALLNEIMAAI